MEKSLRLQLRLSGNFNLTFPSDTYKISEYLLKKETISNFNIVE